MSHSTPTAKPPTINPALQTSIPLGLRLPSKPRNHFANQYHKAEQPANHWPLAIYHWATYHQTKDNSLFPLSHNTSAPKPSTTYQWAADQRTRPLSSRPLPSVDRPLSTAHCPLPTAHCSLPLPSATPKTNEPRPFDQGSLKRLQPVRRPQEQVPCFRRMNCCSR